MTDSLQIERPARTGSPSAAGGATFSADARQQTLASFDWQWRHLARGDFMPGDPWFDANAATVLARELCAIDPAWFEGKSVLDAGCGQGRWTRALLELGARVTALDYSEAGLRRTVEVCGSFPALRTVHADLLSLPSTFAREQFDMVFSFGVLHHTGNTWQALRNISSLVAPGGALVLYLYGADSWTPEQQREIETLRRELADLSFDDKIDELRRRFPSEDPHQLFDLMSPVINERVTHPAVAAALDGAGFDDVAPTIASTEVFVRARRSGFPSSSLLEPVGERSAFAAESSRRSLIRRGAGFAHALRQALADVPRRTIPDAAVHALADRDPNEGVCDLSFPPDQLPADLSPRAPFPGEQWLAEPAEQGTLRTVVFLGGGIGACRFPLEMLHAAWRAVASGGTLVLELPSATSQAKRDALDRMLGYRKPVAEKAALLLRRHSDWTTADALHAIGGAVLANPLPPDVAEAALQAANASQVVRLPARTGTELLIATKP